MIPESDRFTRLTRSLKVVVISAEGGRALIRIADQAHDPDAATTLVLEFALEDETQATYLDGEARIVQRAQRILEQAAEALCQR